MLITKKTGEAAAKVATKLVFIGRAWVNTSKDGKQYLRGSIDKQAGNITFQPGDTFRLFANTKKREGKKDSDYGLAVEVPA